MANPEHVAIVKQGAKVIAQWRETNPGIQFDLREADLRKINLTDANLYRANLIKAHLSWANLTEADLTEADLSKADLSEADLSRADLSRADLSEAFSSKAKLSKAVLYRAALLGANMSKADLSKAVFYRADLLGANLSEANLSGAHLSKADLSEANLSGADFSFAGCARTKFVNVDLSVAKGLESIKHLGPSSIGIDTLLKSKGKIPEVFLRGCGVPNDFIEYIPSLTGAWLQFYTCFISFTDSDNAFSERLYNDLQAEGVRCWRWIEDAKWGRTLLREVDQAIRVYDKLIVILSKDSLKAEPVIREIERALQKEQRDGKEVLFPIRLDDAIFDWQHELQPDVVRKNVGDFCNWEKQPAYKKALDRLIRDLRAEELPEDMT